MNLFYKLSVLMGLIVVISNYLVQFPIQHFGLNDILTYGAFSYPITFFITDLANRAYGKIVAKKIVYIGFIIGIALTLFVSTNFSDQISIRIAIGSGVAFIAQNLDVQIYDTLRKNLVCSSSYFFDFRLHTRYFYIFFNRILCNWHSMGNFSYWRFSCKTYYCNFNASSF